MFSCQMLVFNMLLYVRQSCILVLVICSRSYRCYFCKIQDSGEKFKEVDEEEDYSIISIGYWNDRSSIVEVVQYEFYLV